MLAAFLLANISGFATFICPSVFALYVCRSVCGFGLAGVKNGLYLIGTEFSPPDSRSHVSAVLSYA